MIKKSLFFINFLICRYKFLSFKDFNTIDEEDVSGKPPLLLIITADPLLAASKLALPKGSSHLDETTEILTFLRKFNMKSLFLNPKFFKFLCLKKSFSLGSSPITYPLQSLNSFKIFIIALPKISKPFALFSLPINEIIFFFFEKFIFTLFVD